MSVVSTKKQTSNSFSVTFGVTLKFKYQVAKRLEDAQPSENPSSSKVRLGRRGQGRAGWMEGGEENTWDDWWKADNGWAYKNIKYWSSGLNSSLRRITLASDSPSYIHCLVLSCLSKRWGYISFSSYRGCLLPTSSSLDIGSAVWLRTGFECSKDLCKLEELSIFWEVTTNLSRNI